MRRLLPTLLLAVFLALIGFALPSAGTTFALNYSDPASDVMQLWTSNMTPVLDAGGNVILRPFPEDVNIVWTRSAEPDPGNVTVAVEVRGTIVDLDNTSYEVRLYTRADNASHFIVTYVNGSMTLGSNATGSTPIDISGNSTISATGPNPALTNLLTMRVAKSLLGTITAWNIDATATQVQSVYTFRDFGWEVPGNPGSSPSVLQGHVTEAGSGVALADVAVTTDVGGYATTTDASGAYSLSVAPGRYNVTFSRSGYGSATIQVTIATGQTQTLDAQLTRLSLLEAGFPWIVVGLVALAVILAGAWVVMRRRRKAAPPGPQ